jgi:hypothetical protein
VSKQAGQPGYFFLRQQYRVVCQELNRTGRQSEKYAFTQDRKSHSLRIGLDPTSNMREAKHCTCVLTEEEMETAHQMELTSSA